MATIFTLADNGHDEPTIWVHKQSDEDPWGEDYEPEDIQPIISRSDLPEEVRHYWPTLIARLVNLEEEA